MLAKEGVIMSWNERLWSGLDKIAIVALLAASSLMIWKPLSFKSDASDAGIGLPMPDKIEGTVPATLMKTASTKGHESASVAVIEFADYQCPFCGRSAIDVAPQLLHEFVDTGKVKYVFVNFPLEKIHPFAFKAAEAAECSRRQGQYWEMHDKLFANQRALGETDLLRYADALGLRHNEFASCLDGETQSTIREQVALGHRLQLNSTPTFLIGDIERDGSIALKRKINGALPYQDFKKILNDVIG